MHMGFKEVWLGAWNMGQQATEREIAPHAFLTQLETVLEIMRWSTPSLERQAFLVAAVTAYTFSADQKVPACLECRQVVRGRTRRPGCTCQRCAAHCRCACKALSNRHFAPLVEMLQARILS